MTSAMKLGNTIHATSIQGFIWAAGMGSRSPK
jgi:hypothetical protein